MTGKLPKHDHAFADIEGYEPDIRMWNEASMHAYALAAVAAHKRSMEAMFPTMAVLYAKVESLRVAAALAALAPFSPHGADHRGERPPPRRNNP